MKYYTGIGSRETPEEILLFMGETAKALYNGGYTLRSGGAPGADQAFEFAVWETSNDVQNANNRAEIYLPWRSFEEGKRSLITPARTSAQKPEAFNIAAVYHPRWKFLTPGAMAFHARNVHQVLGYDVTNPVLSEFVVCWTKDAKSGGGTGQAIRIAKAWEIPVYDLADESQMYALTEFLLTL